MDDETKILLKQLLSKLDPEDIQEVLSVGEKKEEPEKNEGSAHIINKRRGSGRNKRNNNRQVGNRKAKKSKKRKKAGKGKQCRTEPMNIDGNRENKFTDFISGVQLSGAEREEMAEAKNEDKKNKGRTFKLPARPSSTIEVECCVCGDEWDVSAALVLDPDRWKCNSCSTQAGW
jgi:hypothetical protein